MEIRKATVDDVDSLLMLSAELGYPSSDEEILTRVEALSGHSDHELLVATASASIVVAWIHLYETLRLESPPFAEIGGLIVHPDHRRKGVARMMLEYARRWVVERGLSRLCVRCNSQRTDGNSFYASEGFVLNKSQTVWHLNL